MPGKPPRLHCILRLLKVVADANGNLAAQCKARWKRAVNEKSDFQIQAYYDYTRHFEPEFGETRKTFDVDFLDHLTLPRPAKTSSGDSVCAGVRGTRIPRVPHRLPAHEPRTPAHTESPEEVLLAW